MHRHILAKTCPGSIKIHPMHGVAPASARERSMTTQSGLSNTFQALPNPRGGAVRIAEMALTDALHAFMRDGDTLGVLRRGIGALHSAGWLPAQRFGETLVLVSPLASLTDKNRNQFAEALRDFSAAVERRNLRELACSTLLFEHYRGLHALMAAHTRAAPVSFDDLALAGRAIAPATLRSISPERLARVRAHYERALLMLLRLKAGELRGEAEIVSILDACLADLAGPDPYDFWRLAGAVVQALRLQPDPDTAADAHRLYARFNLVLADQAHGLSHAPKSLVRAALALLWRDYALYGASAEDSAQVDVLRDYGLTVDWHVAASQASIRGQCSHLLYPRKSLAIVQTASELGQRFRVRFLERCADLHQNVFFLLCKSQCSQRSLIGHWRSHTGLVDIGPVFQLLPYGSY